MEKWRRIPGFSRYEVSTEGRVRSFCQPWRLARESAGWPVGQAKTNDGYLRVSITGDDGLRKTIGVHRLVLLAWVGQPPGDWTASHMNGRPDDNYLNNLAWESIAGNVRRQDPHGSHANKPRGEGHPNAKMTAEKVRALRAAYATTRALRPLAREYAITTTAVLQIVQRRTWKHVD